MRDFFILTFEKILNVVFVLFSLLILLGGVSTMFQRDFWAGLLILFGGFLYLLIIGGMMYIAIGIYHNTKTTAELLQKQLDNQKI